MGFVSPLWRTDRAADLSSADDSTLEMDQAEREELWDLLALLEALCQHMFK